MLQGTDGWAGRPPMRPCGISINALLVLQFAAVLHVNHGQTGKWKPAMKCMVYRSGIGNSGGKFGHQGCRGWGGTTKEECIALCVASTLPDACYRPVGYQCEYAAWRPGSGAGPGSCNNSDSVCGPIADVDGAGGLPAGGCPMVTLSAACGDARRAGVGNCLVCISSKPAEFGECNASVVETFCSGKTTGPPPPPPPPPRTQLWRVVRTDGFTDCDIEMSESGCSGGWTPSEQDCLVCVGTKQHKFAAKGCTQADLAEYCSRAS